MPWRMMALRAASIKSMRRSLRLLRCATLTTLTLRMMFS
jgi:hypothetical protein